MVVFEELSEEELEVKRRDFFERYTDPDEKLWDQDAVDPLGMVSRGDWGAVPPKYKAQICAPLTHVLLLDTGTEGCTETEDCKRIVKDLQTHYMSEKGLPDIPWSFLIGGDGKIYEGRGWVNKPSKLTHYTEPLDGKSFDMAYIGDWNATVPPKKMTFAAKDLIDLGIEKRVIDIWYTFQSEILANFVEVEEDRPKPDFRRFST